MPVGPNGEKRPASPVANAHHVMQVALGIKEEEYVEPKDRESKDPETSSKAEDATAS